MVFFKSGTLHSVNTGFLLNTKADYQSAFPSPRTDGSLLQTDSCSGLYHQPIPWRSMQSPSEMSSYYFRHCIIPVLSSLHQGSKGRKVKVSQVRNALLPQNPHCVSFPILRQLRLHTCFSLYGQAPSFLICFTIFSITLRTPGSHSNICSQIQSFKFTAHVLQLALLRDPNKTPTPKTCLHFTFHLYFSFSGIQHFNSHSYQGDTTSLGVLFPNFTET